MRISAAVGFHSPLTLEKVAEMISTQLLGGVRFVGREEFLRDEVPALRSESEILGLRFVVFGFGGESGYALEIYPRHSSDPLFKVNNIEDEVDCSRHLAGLLGRLPGINNAAVSS